MRDEIKKFTLGDLLLNWRNETMSDKQKESRIDIEDLPQNGQELTPEESKEVQGGAATQGRALFVISTAPIAPEH